MVSQKQRTVKIKKLHVKHRKDQFGKLRDKDGLYGIPVHVASTWEVDGEECWWPVDNHTNEIGRWYANGLEWEADEENYLRYEQCEAERVRQGLPDGVYPEGYDPEQSRGRE